jgi:hypothetical protein
MDYVETSEPVKIPEAACNGAILWEIGTRWWHCQACGHRSYLTYTWHTPMKPPPPPPPTRRVTLMDRLVMKGRRLRRRLKL